MRQYLDLMEHVLADGVEKRDRTGTGTLSVFGHQMRFDLGAGLSAGHHQEAAPEVDRPRAAVVPAPATPTSSISTTTACAIWDEWADERGDLGPVYGQQWRSWPAQDGKAIDQIANVVEMIRRNPDSRRLIVTAWNPADVDKMALPPCHCLFQFYVAKGRLSCQLYQRSADVFLGVPFNIASYALLTMMVAQVTGLAARRVHPHASATPTSISTIIEQARLQLSRAPRPLPTMRLNPAVKDIFAFRYEDFALEGYEPHPHIKAEVAV